MPRPRTPRPTSVALGGIVALGATAALRRATEVRHERSGHIDRLGPGAATDLPSGRFDARIAGWIPARPHDRRTRTAAAAWAAPATVAGLVLARLGRGQVTWRGDVGAWVATGVRGPSGMVLRRAGMTANTAGQTVLCTTR